MWLAFVIGGYLLCVMSFDKNCSEGIKKAVFFNVTCHCFLFTNENLLARVFGYSSAPHLLLRSVNIVTVTGV